MLHTVGGSHQPILKARESISPAFVCLFRTDNDPETGSPDSPVHVTAKGNITKARLREKIPTLPNIPTSAGLDDDRFEARTVPADDLSRGLTRHA